jgi:hypothetical protein
MQTWELVTALTSIHSIPLHLHVPVPRGQSYSTSRDQIELDFDLADKPVEYFAVGAESSQTSGKELLQKRDDAVFADADILVPISVSRNGSMNRRIDQSDKNICDRFVTPYDSYGTNLAYTLGPAKANSALKTIGDDLIIHWTRGINGAWPGERRIDLYQSILLSDTWPRDALATLERIIQSGKILASSRHMPGKVPTVSFSALSPLEVIPLIRWRARYAQMSFEPYGIGIERTTALKAGIKPVIYGSKGDVSDCENWLRQSMGNITDWRNEKEYRCRSDFLLDALPRDKLTLFCRYADEAEAMETEFGIKAYAFE